MLNKLIDYGETITLTPQSGIQIVEYGFDLADTPRFTRSFIERPSEQVNENGDIEFTLLPNWDDEDPEAEPPHLLQASDDEYDVSKVKALDTFMGVWIPVPFLRIEPGKDRFGNETYAPGPADWVRVKLVETSETHGDREATHRLIFAFDTSLVDRKARRPYLAPSPDDARQTESFRFVHNLKDVGGFLSNRGEKPPAKGQAVQDTQAWLTSWIESIFRDVKAARYPNRPLREDDFPHNLEHIAHFITFVGFISRAVKLAKISLIDTVSERPNVAPIDVDFILDIGNARTCGLLIQSFPNDESTDLNRSLVLELRDLTNPELVYREPFESHVEMMQAEFGPEDLARQSGRARAFFWPSIVRLGPEATRVRVESEGTEATTGLSSPKRYLWDVDEVTQNWNVRLQGKSDLDFQPLIERSIYRFVNNRGDVLSQLAEDKAEFKLSVRAEDMESADALRFSRSSFFTFMMMETLCQALMMINSPGVRRRDREKDSPRRLRRIVLTIPSATPVQEQRIIRSRTQAAVKLLWALMGWDDDTPGAPKKPEINTSWDEASSVHLVYLFGEITQKLGGSIEALFDIYGKTRPRTDHEGTVTNPEPEKSLRIASVDIGGGTTDLMVTTYYQLDNQALTPVQNFREGFRRAGDDLLKLVVERIVIPAIEKGLVESGVKNARDLLKELFADDSPGMSELDKHLRRQFVLCIMRPVGLGILSECEQDENTTSLPATRNFASFFDDSEGVLSNDGRIAQYLTQAAEQRGAQDFSLANVTVEISHQLVEECIGSAFDKIFANIAEAIYKLDADIVLLTGRPSCQPGVINLFRNQLGIAIDRIVPLRDYRVGNWYPFRQPARSLIADPKTTAVVGGMLCTLASGQLTNFRLYTEGLAMRSTAQFIGELRQDGIIPDNKVYFSNVDLDSNAATAMEATFPFHTAVRLGYRQLPRSDWVSAPLYRLRFTPGANRDRLKGALRVTLERNETDAEETDAFSIMKSEATREEFKVTSAEDQEGTNLKKLVELKFDTSPVGQSDGVYWLDSGILTIA